MERTLGDMQEAKIDFPYCINWMDAKLLSLLDSLGLQQSHNHLGPVAPEALRSHGLRGSLLASRARWASYPQTCRDDGAS